MAQQFVYTMKGLGKVVPPKKQILKDIWLSFYPGAKIGVLGNNGSGKSSLMRIMAGEDSEFTGEAFPMEGLQVGHLPQEPVLDESKDVFGNVEDGVRDKREMLQRFEDLSMKMAEPMSDAEMDKLMEEHGKIQDAIEAANAWDLDREVEMAMDALRCPPGDAKISTLSGGEKRRVALCRLLLERPDMLLLDEPTNETGLWLEQRTGVVRRLLGLPPLAGISQETMSTWHDLERLTSRLAEALAPYSANTSSFELGSGQHRVFVLKDSDGLSVFARPVFREKPRRVISVELDGTLLVPRRHRSDREISMEEGVEVIASGDRILFCHPDGEQVHGIFLPWIGAADRKELTRRLQALVGSRSEGERVIGKDEGNLNATLSQLLPS